MSFGYEGQVSAYRYKYGFVVFSTMRNTFLRHGHHKNSDGTFFHRHNLTATTIAEKDEFLIQTLSLIVRENPR